MRWASNLIIPEFRGGRNPFLSVSVRQVIYIEKPDTSNVITQMLLQGKFSWIYSEATTVVKQVHHCESGVVTGLQKQSLERILPPAKLVEWSSRANVDLFCGFGLMKEVDLTLFCRHSDHYKCTSIITFHLVYVIDSILFLLYQSTAQLVAL